MGVTEKHSKEHAVVGHNHWNQKGKSCSMNLISFYDNITHPIDQGNIVDFIFLDFSQVFDAVSHSILMDKNSSMQLNKNII